MWLLGSLVADTCILQELYIVTHSQSDKIKQTKGLEQTTPRKAHSQTSL